MPTGYTEIIEREGGATFAQYLWRCARAFGPTIMQRDESLDAPARLMLEPLPHYAEQRAKAEAKLRELETLTLEQAAALCDAEHEADVKRIEEWRLENKAARARYAAMRDQVTRWEPPTPDHVALKRFMLEQISVGDPGDWVPSQDPKRSPADWLANALTDARDALVYYADAERKENERCAEATRWLQALAASVPQQEPKR